MATAQAPATRYIQGRANAMAMARGTSANGCMSSGPAGRDGLAAGAVADVLRDEVGLGVDGGRGVVLHAARELGAQGIKVHLVDQARRVPGVADARILAIDEEEGEPAARIELVDDLRLLSVELIEVRAVVGLELLRGEVQVVTGIGSWPEIVGRDPHESEGVLVMGIFGPASQGSEPFQGADQRPPLCGAVWSALDAEEEDPNLISRPRRVGDDVELALARRDFAAG